MHLLTIRQAAVLLHCHPYSIYGAIYEGRIQAVKMKGMVRIPADEVERLAARKEKLNVKLGVTDVAKILACSESTVLRTIRAHKLKTEQLGNKYLVAPEELENYVLSLPKI